MTKISRATGAAMLGAPYVIPSISAQAGQRALTISSRFRLNTRTQSSMSRLALGPCRPE